MWFPVTAWWFRLQTAISDWLYFMLCFKKRPQFYCCKSQSKIDFDVQNSEWIMYVRSANVPPCRLELTTTGPWYYLAIALSSILLSKRRSCFIRYRNDNFEVRWKYRAIAQWPSSRARSTRTTGRLLLDIVDSQYMPWYIETLTIVDVSKITESWKQKQLNIV